jgi:hypothetical protein
MLVLTSMKTAKLMLCSWLLASPALAGPDFKSDTPKGGELTASNGTREMLPSDDLIFAHDSAELTESSRAQLESIARFLTKRRDLRLVVEGYTDHVGEAAYNIDLATRRAHATKAYLVARGVSAERLVLAVFGETVADPAGSSLDRRVIVYASPRDTRSLATYVLDIRRALYASWTNNKTWFTEQRTARYVAIAGGPRRR